MAAGDRVAWAGRRLLDRYELEEEIGRGGMGTVWRARDATLDRPVAVKLLTLPPDPTVRAQLRARFRQEAAVAARLSHPHVVHVYDYGTDPDTDQDFLVMELLRGVDLRRRLAERGPLGREGARVVLEAARGLSAGHRAGLVHRDVKPSNLFLVGDGERIEFVKVLDFGIAKPLDLESDGELTLPGTSPHSPAYAAPEQLVAGGEVSPATDVFGLGLVAYEALTGQRPYDAAARARLLAGERLPPRWDGPGAAVAPPLRPVLERALDPDPGRRYPDAAAFAEAWSAALRELEDDRTLVAPLEPRSDDATVVLPGDRGAPRPSAPSGRRRAAALALLVPAAVFALWFLASRRPATPTGPSMEELRERRRALQVELAQQEANGPIPEPTDAGIDAARAIEAVLLASQRAWVDGDLATHLAAYADWVDFYGRRLNREAIGRLRAQSRALYDEVRLELRSIAVHLRGPDAAEALVRKAWSFRAGERRWVGEALQAFDFRREDGTWRIVGERDVRILRDERDE